MNSGASWGVWIQHPALWTPFGSAGWVAVIWRRRGSECGYSSVWVQVFVLGLTWTPDLAHLEADALRLGRLEQRADGWEFVAKGRQ